MQFRGYMFSKFKQGVYKPKNPQKYKGTLPIIYRSSLELRFFNWCDSNNNIITWGSESVVIPYISPLDGRMHRYFPDNNLTIKDRTGNTYKYIVEIKPSDQINQPIKTPRKQQRTFIREQKRFLVNNAKWESCKKWCDNHNYKFQIITEKHVGCL